MRGGLLFCIANQVVNRHARRPSDFIPGGVHDLKANSLTSATLDQGKSVTVDTWDVLTEKPFKTVVTVGRHHPNTTGSRPSGPL